MLICKEIFLRYNCNATYDERNKLEATFATNYFIPKEGIVDTKRKLQSDK